MQITDHFHFSLSNQTLAAAIVYYRGNLRRQSPFFSRKFFFHFSPFFLCHFREMFIKYHCECNNNSDDHDTSALDFVLTKTHFWFFLLTGGLLTTRTTRNEQESDFKGRGRKRNGRFLQEGGPLPICQEKGSCCYILSAMGAVLPSPPLVPPGLSQDKDRKDNCEEVYPRILS